MDDGEKTEGDMTLARTGASPSRPAAHSLEDTVSMLKAIAHPCRLRLLILLGRGQVCDVTTLTHLCDKSQPYISQQLRILRDAGVVIGDQDGLRVCYRIANERVWEILQATGELEPAMAVNAAGETRRNADV